MSALRYTCAVLAGATALYGCAGAGAPSTPADVATDATAGADGALAQPEVVSKAARSFVEGWLALLRDQDPQRIAAAVDRNAFMKRMFAGTHPSESQRRAAVDDALGSHPQHPVLTLIPKGTSHRLLSINARKGGGVEALARMTYTDDSTQLYIIWLIGPDKGNGYRMIDAKVLAMDTWFSSILNDVWRLQWAAERRGMLTRMTKGGMDKVVGQYRTATGQLKADSATAIASYDALPATLKRRPYALAFYMTMLLQRFDETGSDEARKALQTVLDSVDRGALPPAASGLSSYDGWVALKRYDRALAAANRLAKASSGRDAWVEVMRAGAYEGEGDAVMAREHAERAVKLERNLWVMHWSLLRLTLHAKRYRDAQTIVREMYQRFQWFPNDDLDYGEDKAAFEAFFETDIYRSLIEELSDD